MSAATSIPAFRVNVKPGRAKAFPDSSADGYAI